MTGRDRMGLTKEEKREYQRAYMARKRSNKETNKEVGLTGEGLTKQGSNTKGLTVWEAGGYRGEWIDGVFCVNGKPYRIGDILDLQHAPYGFINNLYRLSHA